MKSTCFSALAFVISCVLGTALSSTAGAADDVDPPIPTQAPAITPDIDPVPPGSPDAPPAPPLADDLPRAVQEALTEAVVLNPKLHGVSATVVPSSSRPPMLEVRLIVDADPDVAKSQEAEVARIVSAFVPPNRIRLNTWQRLPFRQLLRGIRRRVELSPQLVGISVTDAYYVVDNNSQLYLVLVGRVARDEDRAAVIDLANLEIARTYPVGITLVARSDPVVDLPAWPRLARVAPTDLVGTYCFNLGVLHYLNHDYASAYHCFTSAAIESPSRTDLPYWRIVALIGANRADDALSLLTYHVGQRRAASAPLLDTSVLRSLERVQGPIRQQWVQMENNLLCGHP